MIELRTVRRWTEQEEQLARDHYQGENRNSLTTEALAVLLDRTPAAVKGMVSILGLRSNGHRQWTEEELDYVNENYGLLTDKVIGRHLNRTPVALRLAVKRHMVGVNHKTNFYTGRDLARLFGISCSKTVTAWHKKDFLRGKKAPVHCGKNFMWGFQYEDIEKCLRRRPWLVEINKMEESFFRSIVREEYEKDPWYTCDQAAPLLGILDHNAVKRYIRCGWLPAERKPAGGTWQWIIRGSGIDAFLQNDPRVKHRHQAYSKARRNYWRKYHISRTYWAKKMATAVMVGRGVRVNRCPIGREVCHLACHFRKEDRCHYCGPIGRQLTRARRKKKERR